MKVYEKESLLKSFLLFFSVIEVFLIVILYRHYQLEDEHLGENLFLQMKNYSLFFDDDRFDIDVVDNEKDSRLYELHKDEDTLYILVPFADDEDDLLKIYYPITSYYRTLAKIRWTTFLYFFILSFIAVLISSLFSFYALRPMRESLKLLEEFIRDIIHDLNTPITSILLNLKMMPQRGEEVESIAVSAKAISMLHKNLDTYLRDMKFSKEPIFIKEVIDEQVKFFSSMYDYLDWRVDVDDFSIKSDKNALSRIIYNLLSNACKYNTSNGFIEIVAKNGELSIRNDSYGIKDPSKLFNRFYRESQRGLGIGLHIVQKLSDELNIKRNIKVNRNIFTINLIF